MPSVDGYTTDKIIPIHDGAFTDAEISGDDLILTRNDSTTKNAGSVRGDQGLIGEPGPLSQSDIDLVTDTVDFGSWNNLSFAANWSNYGGQFAGGQFRYSDYEVQFRGVLLYSGPQVTGNEGGGSWTRVDIATLPPVITPPENLVIKGCFGGTEVMDLRADTNGDFYFWVYYANLRYLETSSWVSLQDSHWFR